MSSSIPISIIYTKVELTNPADIRPSLPRNTVLQDLRPVTDRLLVLLLRLLRLIRRLHAVEVEVTNLRKQVLPRSFELLIEDRHLVELVLDVLPLVTVLLVYHVVDQGSQDPVDFLLSYAHLVLSLI